MAATYAGSSVAQPPPATYDYYPGANYPHTTTYHQPPAWSSAPVQHPASTPATWGEFAPGVAHHQFPASSSRSSVVEMSYSSQTASPVVGEQQWNRRYSEGAAVRERPGSIPRPMSAAPSSLANFNWPGASSVQSTNGHPEDHWHSNQAMPPPIPPTTFASVASPVLIQQSIPDMTQHQLQYHPQTFHSSPPSVLASASPPTPTQSHPFVAHSVSPSFAHTSVGPGRTSRPSKSPPTSGTSPQKRGRRPKNYVKTAEDERIEREEYLERNRIAALKSRQRKKERMGNLEAQAQEYCNHNDSLQKYALTLQSELLHLRSILSQLGGQSFPDVDGYLEREAKGGGIPTILRIAGPTLERDYQAVARV